MIGSILQFKDLQKLCKPDAEPPPRRAAVEAWAKKIGLLYTYDARGGIMSTIDAVNKAIGLKAAANDDAQLGPEDV